jgi:hypothetical protein
MDGRSNFLSKAFGLVMDMDKLVGKDFETGLSNLKGLAEADASKEAAAAPQAPPPTPAEAPPAAVPAH